mgnify:FL=1
MKLSRITSTMLGIAILASSCGQSDRYIAIQGYAQGGTYTVKMNLRGTEGMIRKSPTELKTAIDSILNDIDTTLSGYNKGSLLSRFNAGKRIPLNDMFADVYSRAYEYYEETAGALDVASGPIFDLWGFGFTKDTMPSADRINAVLASCGMGRMKADILTAGPYRPPTC